MYVSHKSLAYVKEMFFCYAAKRVFSFTPVSHQFKSIDFIRVMRDLPQNGFCIQMRTVMFLYQNQ